MESLIPAAMAMASRCRLQSRFIKKMHWPGIVWRGRVTGVGSGREPAGAND
ncbi:MAG: hypothetical protein ACLPYB_02330 [Desulfobaccales bacterium]